MMRANHLTAEEIIKYMDTSDLSEAYLLWMEEVSEHLLSCNECQGRLRKALIVESICEDGGLQAGLQLLAKEEKIRVDFWNRDWERRQALEPVACVTGFPNNQGYNNHDYLRRFTFSTIGLRRAAAAVRGSDAEDRKNTADTNARQPIMPEICGDKLIVKVAGELVREQLGIAVQKFNVVLCPTGKEPMRKEAAWNEAGGYYAAEFDIGEVGEQFEVWIL